MLRRLHLAAIKVISGIHRRGARIINFLLMTRCDLILVFFPTAADRQLHQHAALGCRLLNLLGQGVCACRHCLVVLKIFLQDLLLPLLLSFLLLHLHRGLQQALDLLHHFLGRVRRLQHVLILLGCLRGLFSLRLFTVSELLVLILTDLHLEQDGCQLLRHSKLLLAGSLVGGRLGDSIIALSRDLCLRLELLLQHGSQLLSGRGLCFKRLLGRVYCLWPTAVDFRVSQTLIELALKLEYGLDLILLLEQVGGLGEVRLSVGYVTVCLNRLLLGGFLLLWLAWLVKAPSCVPARILSLHTVLLLQMRCLVVLPACALAT